MENDQYPLNHQPSPEFQPAPGPGKEMLPGSLATLILGIASLANMALFGWIPALIAYGQFKKAREAEEMNPGKYSPTSVNMAHSGKRMADIGLVLGILGMIVTFLYYYWIISEIFGARHHLDFYNYGTY